MLSYRPIKYVRTSVIAVSVLASMASGLMPSIALGSVSLAYDDFEGYAANAWPSQNWVADGNAATDPSRNNVVYDPADANNQVLGLYGQTSGSWAAIAYTPCAFDESFTIDVAVRNGSETMNGDQPYRASILMRHGTYWWAGTNPARTLLLFGGNGYIMTGDDRVLQTYDTDLWYDVTIQYTRAENDLALHYWIDGVDRGISNITISDLGIEASLDHVNLTAHQGSAYFDNLSVTANAVPVPGSILLGALGLGAVGWIKRRKVKAVIE